MKWFKSFIRSVSVLLGTLSVIFGGALGDTDTTLFGIGLLLLACYLVLKELL